MPNTIIQTDDLNEHDWQQITTTYDDDNSTILKVETLYDNGLIERKDFDVSSSYFYKLTYVDLDDPSRNPTAETVASGGLFSWQNVSIQPGYNPVPGSGAGPYLFFNSATFDNGEGYGVLKRLYSNPNDTVISLDTNDQQDWGFKAEVFREDGTTLEYKMLILDSGMNQSENYNENGQLVSMVQWDHVDIEPWTTMVLDYNPSTGALVRKTITDFESDDNYPWKNFITNYADDGSVSSTRYVYDNDLSVSTYYSDGQKTSQTKVDAGDEYSWYRVTTNYDSDGNLELKVTDKDNGIRQTQEWENGVLVKSVSQDLQDAVSWSSVEITYDSAGKMIRKTVEKDNGILSDTFIFADGSKKIVSDDTGDIKNWDKTIVQVDASGNRSLSAVLEDDGDVIANYFDDGARSMQVFEDVSDSRSWYARVKNYDENGDLVDTVYYDSYEDLNDATGYTSPFPEIA